MNCSSRTQPKAKLRQVDVAKRLGRYQSYVTNIETGQRRIDVVELVELAEAIGFDPREATARLRRSQQRHHSSPFATIVPEQKRSNFFGAKS
jgi:transcriptional regulator with XRE-family HTH domain